MSRSAILPPESDRLTDADIDRVARVRLERTSPPTPPDPFRAAADAVTQLAQTLGACAREVETRGGQRVARGMRHAHIEDANSALMDLIMALPGTMKSSAEQEVLSVIEGCTYGYVRETWALRIIQMGAEVARDTEPGSEVSHG